MTAQRRSIVMDPAGLRRTLHEAIRGFCHEVLLANGLVNANLLEDPTLAGEKDRIVLSIARRWQDSEADFEPDDPPSAESFLASGGLTPAVVEAIDRFCKDVLIARGHLREADWTTHRLDGEKYAIARRVSRGWVSEASAV